MLVKRLGEHAQVVRSVATGVAFGTRRGRDIRLLPLSIPDIGEPAHADRIARLVQNANVAQLQSRMSDGQLTAVQVAAHLIGQLAEGDPLHSLVSVNPDILVHAQIADDRRARGEVGPLLGIPLTIKDNIETAGEVPTTGGAEILLQNRPGRDAALVAALRQAGAVILGKANLSELAGAVVRHPGFSAVAGQTRNPLGNSFSPGGSSSGSAVGVAAGLTPASIGTETSGSLLAPAAFSGMVAVKPSRGLVDARGIIPLVRHQDTAGPVARTVADAAVLLQAMTAGGVVAELTNTTLSGITVGLLARDIECQPKGLEDTSDAVEVRVRLENRLQAAGARVVTVELTGDDPLRRIGTELVTVVLGGLSHDTVDYLHAAGTSISSAADLQAYNLRKPRRRMPAGQSLLSLAVARGVSRDSYETKALEVRAAASRALDQTFLAAGTDLLISVSNIHSAIYASAGYPAVTLPAGMRRNGMPVGLTMIGPLGSDAWLLGMAAALERAQ